MKKLNKTGYTLSEVILACVIVGVISALIIPSLVTHYQDKNFELAKKRIIQAVSNSVDTLVINENTDFFKTYMYTDTEPESYDDYSGKFLKKYLKISKYCGDNGKACFAPVYYEYKDKDKKVYTPELKGSCALLKDGVSMCLKPQIGAAGVSAIVDLNGPKGPNVLGKDLETFELPVKMRSGFDITTQDVIVAAGYIRPEISEEETEDKEDDPDEPTVTPTPEPPAPTPPTDSCDIDYNGLACCRTRAISGIEDSCCTYGEIYDSNGGKNNCHEKFSVSFSYGWATAVWAGYGDAYSKCEKGEPMGCYELTYDFNSSSVKYPEQLCITFDYDWGSVYTTLPKKGTLTLCDPRRTPFRFYYGRSNFKAENEHWIPFVYNIKYTYKGIRINEVNGQAGFADIYLP